VTVRLGEVTGQVLNRVQDPFVVLVDRCAEDERIQDGHRLQLELILEGNP
jgi:hypothetical protein